MPDLKITGLTATTAPVSTDIVPTVVDPAGTPLNRKVTFANVITKAHGLGNGLLKVAASTMAVATANTDYATPTGMAADALQVGSIIVPQHIEVDVHVQTAALGVDQVFFIANRAYQVTDVRFAHAVAESIAGTLNVQVTKDTGTTAPGAGTDLLTNNTNAGFDAKATANTVQTGTLTATAADLQLAVGNRLSLDFSTAATDLAGVHVTVTLKRI